MYISDLKDNLQKELSTADEVWIAVGLIAKNALSYIENLNAKIHILVGIDLPTPPDVLKQLLEWTRQGKINFKVFSSEETFFHPKVYIWRKGNSFKSYVGSGNMTEGGWKNNVELFWQIEKGFECQKLIRWFEKNLAMSIAIDEKFIDDYENSVFKPSEDARNAQRRRLKEFKKNYDNDYEFYFRQEDFDTFTYQRAVNTNSVAKEARKIVNRKLLHLHNLIFPKIRERGLDLYHHQKEQNIVSSFAHTARNSKTLDGMWLYYGKSPDEAAAHNSKNDAEKSMNNHVRLQLIIRENIVGIWCAVGKGGGSRVDRQHFYEKMRIEKNREDFFVLLKSLGDEYYVQVAGRDVPYYLRDVFNSQQLNAIAMEDHNNQHEYFIIGMDLIPSDPRLLDKRLENFIVDEFEKLYPVYNFFRAPVCKINPI